MHQIDIALVQLERACNLFFEGDFICALTLAGAAEEILGEIANKESKKLLGRKKGNGVSALNLQAGIMQDFFGVNYFEYLKNRNRIKNSLKHAMPNYIIEMDELELTTKQFIGDAITNYKLLSKQLPAISSIQKFCKVVGVS